MLMFNMNEWMPPRRIRSKVKGDNQYFSPDDMCLNKNLDNHQSYRDYIKTKSKRR